VIIIIIIITNEEIKVTLSQKRCRGTYVTYISEKPFCKHRPSDIMTNYVA